MPVSRRLLLTLPAIALLSLVSWLLWLSETGADHLQPVSHIEFASSDDVLPPDAKAWQSVALPLRFCQVVHCRAAFEWARFRFPLDVLPDQRWGLYLPQFESAAHVFLNGTRVAELGQIQGRVSDYGGHPQLIPLPADILHTGVNTLELQFGEVAWGFGKLSPFYLGPMQQLEDAFLIRDLTQNGLLGSAVFLMLPILLFTVVFAFFGERDPILVAFAGLMFFYLLRTAHGLPVDQWLPHAGHVFIDFLATLGLLASAYGFVARWTGCNRPIVELLLWVVVCMSLLHIGFELSGDVRLGIIRGNAITRFAVLLLVPYLLFLVVRYLLKSPNWPVATVAGALATTAFLAIYDAVRSWPPAMPDAYYAGLGPPLLVFAFAVELAYRVAEKSRAVGLANEELSRRVSAREAELADNYQRLKEIEDEQLLSHERQRIMRDMHDGVGGRLAALSNQMRTESVTTDRVQAAVQDSLQDLRLLISSLDTTPDDLGLAMGTLRPRLERWLQEHDVRLDWVCEVDSKGYGPRAVLHIYRIVQEACSNAVRHSGCGVVSIAITQTAEEILVRIADDGQGMQPSSETGQGLRNLNYRAAALGGLLEVGESESGGVLLQVQIPRQQPVSDSGRAWTDHGDR